MKAVRSIFLGTLALILLISVTAEAGNTVEVTITKDYAHQSGNWDSPDKQSVKRYTHAHASSVEFIPPAWTVIDLGTRVKISPDTKTESKAEYDLDALYDYHRAKHGGLLKVVGIGGPGIGPPPTWSVTAKDALDLDVDSDNNNGYNTPNRSVTEDMIEEDEPGKIFCVNDGDLDNDKIADFCDGFNASAEITDDNILDTTKPCAFGIPMVLEIKKAGGGCAFFGCEIHF